MAKTIRIHNVPDEVYRALTARAAENGMTLSEYMLSKVGYETEKPTLSDLMDRLAEDEPVELDESSATTIRRFRDAEDPRDLG
jgi:plasmid stability protein